MTVTCRVLAVWLLVTPCVFGWQPALALSWQFKAKLKATAERLDWRLRPVRKALRERGGLNIVESLSALNGRHPTLAVRGWQLVEHHLRQVCTKNTVGVKLPRSQSTDLNDLRKHCTVLSHALDHAQTNSFADDLRRNLPTDSLSQRKSSRDSPESIVQRAIDQGTRLGELVTMARSIVDACSSHDSDKPPSKTVRSLLDGKDQLLRPLGQAPLHPGVRSLLYPRLLEATAYAVADPRIDSLQAQAMWQTARRVGQGMSLWPTHDVRKTWKTIISQVITHAEHASNLLFRQWKSDPDTAPAPDFTDPQQKEISAAVDDLVQHEQRARNFIAAVDKTMRCGGHDALNVAYCAAINEGVHRAKVTQWPSTMISGREVIIQHWSYGF